MRGDEDASASAADRARARLDRSRLAILDYLQQAQGAPRESEPAGEPSPGAGSDRWSHLCAAGRRYWDRHPARLAIRLLAPALSFWGRRHPAAFAFLAAGLGALLVVARPWRLVSVSGLALAAVKSPHLASLAMSAMASLRTHERESERTPP